MGSNLIVKQVWISPTKKMFAYQNTIKTFHDKPFQEQIDPPINNPGFLLPRWIEKKKQAINT